MNAISMQAMSDEFFKIAKAGKAVSWVGKHLKGIGRNLKGAVHDLTTPVKSVKRELKSAKRDVTSVLANKKAPPDVLSKITNSKTPQQALAAMHGRHKTMRESNKFNADKSARNKRLFGHGLNVGMTGLMAHSALKKDDETGEGQSRVKRLSRLAGSTLGGLATAKRGLTGGILGTVAGDQVGKMVGSAADLVTRNKSKREA